MYSEFDCRHLLLPPTRILLLLSQLKNLYITSILRRFDRPTNCGPTMESSSSTSKRWVHCHTFQDTIWSPKRSRPTMGSRLVVQWRGKISFSSISKEKSASHQKFQVLCCSARVLNPIWWLEIRLQKELVNLNWIHKHSFSHFGKVVNTGCYSSISLCVLFQRKMQFSNSTAFWVPPKTWKSH